MYLASLSSRLWDALSFEIIDSVGEAIPDAFCPSSPASELDFEGPTELVAVFTLDPVIWPSHMPARRIIFIDGCTDGTSSATILGLYALNGVGLVSCQPSYEHSVECFYLTVVYLGSCVDGRKSQNYRHNVVACSNPQGGVQVSDRTSYMEEDPEHVAYK